MNGHLTSITLGTGDTIWTLKAQNSRLLPTQVGLGGLGQSLSYDSRGNVTERVVTGLDENELQWQEYDYDTVTGNMGARSDWTHDTSEWFDYDNQNRLTDIGLYSPSLGYRDRSTTYDGKGNILSHSTAGQYGYGTAKPYAFSELLLPSVLILQREQHIAFNAMQQPDTISEGGHTAVFSYYGDMTRSSMTVSDSLVQAPDNTQNYNRYSYCLNNPLRYVDKFGTYTEWHILLPEIECTALAPKDNILKINDFGINMTLVDLIRSQRDKGLDHRFDNSQGNSSSSTAIIGSSSNNSNGDSNNIIQDMGHSPTSTNSSTDISSIIYFSDLLLSSLSIIQYDEFLGYWQTSNGKINFISNTQSYESLLAKDLSLSLGRGATAVSALSIANRWITYYNSNVGPNVKEFYKRRAIRGTFIDALGSIPEATYLNIFSLSYGFAELTNDFVLSITGGQYSIQYNPYTHDFTSIEKTLRELDESGLYIY